VTRSAGADGWMASILNVYLAVFLVYMFLPLTLMVVAGFNAHPQPSATQWSGFTLRWFVELWNDRGFWEGFQNSLLIGAGVVLLSVPLGLARAA
jgi:spermidine/putrescine transport system permease protein